MLLSLLLLFSLSICCTFSQKNVYKKMNITTIFLNVCVARRCLQFSCLCLVSLSLFCCSLLFYLIFVFFFHNVFDSVCSCFSPERRLFVAFYFARFSASAVASVAAVAVAATAPQETRKPNTSMAKVYL